MVNEMISISGAVLLDLVIGVFIGEIFDFIYDRKLNNIEDRYMKRFPFLQNLFHWFEHYHWGMVLLMYYCPVLNGFGLSLILDENRSDLGFGYERDTEKRTEFYHFKESSVIGMIIFVVLISRWLLL